MRSHCALYVDVGYLLAAAATRAAGTSLRSSIRVDHKRLIESLIAHVTEASGLPLLRVHWYDAARNGVPDETQEKIGLLPRVKVRLGRIGVDGEQKGVDLRIGLDLVAHARNEAVDVVFLVSGDDDLTEAVEEAQAHGVQVTVLAVPNKKGDPQSVSRYLQRAADGLELITAGALDAAVRSRTTGILDAPPPGGSGSRRDVPSPTLLAGRASGTEASVGSSPEPKGGPVVQSAAESVGESVSPPAGGSDAGLVYSSRTGGGTMITPEFLLTPEEITSTTDEVISRVLLTWLGGRPAEQWARLKASRPSIPQDVDRALLLDLSDALNMSELTDTVRYELRARFWLKVDSIGSAAEHLGVWG